MKSTVGIIGGTLFYKSPLFAKAKPTEIKNCYGNVELTVSKKIAFISRHGMNHNIPPHKINHASHMLALKEAGVKYVIGVCSVGSLHSSLLPGTLVVPDDYINLWNQSTIFKDSVVHITPELDEELRLVLIECAKELDCKIKEKGTYVQTIGPRLETKAEIKMLSNFADIVGMTMGQEATIAQELGLKYAAICSVDNYANGIHLTNVSSDEILTSASQNSEKIKDVAVTAAEKLAKQK